MTKTKQKEYDCTGCGATQQSKKGKCDSCKGIPKQFKTLQAKEDKLHERIDAYFAKKYKTAKTPERIEIRGMQRAIMELVEVNLLLEAECNQ